MDCRTGEIHSGLEDEISKWKDAGERSFDEVQRMVSLTNDEAEEISGESPVKRKGWMKNKPCVCGSGKKFKRCCWGKFSK